MVAVICVSVLIHFVLWWFIALEFFSIVQKKGYYIDADFSRCKYFYWIFLTGVIGILMVIALPDRKDPSDTNAVNNNDLPEI